MHSKSKRKHKTTYVSPRNQNEFIKLLAQECHSMVIEEVNAADVRVWWVIQHQMLSILISPRLLSGMSIWTLSVFSHMEVPPQFRESTIVYRNVCDILKRLIMYIACLQHGSNLVIEHFCQVSSFITDMYHVLEATYIFLLAVNRGLISWKKS